jgi:hypothetical protein
LDNLTLQINLSPGDINYAELTVPQLVAKHPDIKNRLLIVDCCRPQKTTLIDPDIRFPLDIFNEKVERIINISQQLLRDKIVTDVRYLKPGDPIFKHLSKKYLNGIYDCTHAAGGTANMSYWAAIEIPETRYVLHYDGDMLLYQKPGNSWVNDAMVYLDHNDRFITAVPRLCPPVNDPTFDLPSFQEGRPNVSYNNYWFNDFFSTQVFLLDKTKLNKHLPLVTGKLLFELLLRKYGRRAFPRDPEIVLFKKLAPNGRIVLKNTGAWVVHPTDKSAAYLDILPQIITAVNKGDSPQDQKGYQDIKLDKWVEFLAGINYTRST